MKVDLLYHLGQRAAINTLVDVGCVPHRAMAPSGARKGILLELLRWNVAGTT